MQSRTVPFLLAGPIFLGMGVFLVWFSLDRVQPSLGWGSVALVLLVACFSLAIGGALIYAFRTHRGEIVIDGDEDLIRVKIERTVRRPKFGENLFREERIPLHKVERLELRHRPFPHGSISLVLVYGDNQSLTLDHATSKNKLEDLGRRIARVANIDFVDPQGRSLRELV
jgi:hypothetical protein